ncbi:MAG: L-2-hydroxyglutarate oxidase [Trueperaceae bacterium]|nr:MAG: L-2-hydroxyglutarate oxidase [Trueperaceae bacterium]
MTGTLDVDLCVVGGGIVGLATAHAVLQRMPDARIVVLEKEDAIARHQTGHNSGVVHAGIYYRPGTLRASLCVRGVARLRDFCAEHGVAYDAVGKVIVATDESELPRLDALLERGMANGVPGLRMIDRDELLEIEPRAAGLRALHSPGTAIADFPGVSRVLADRLRAGGARVETNAHVVDVARSGDGLTIDTPRLRVRARRLVACAGLHADRLARLAGLAPSVRIVPFRGEYYFLEPHARDLVRGLIYPVPDPDLPFLGVHFTRTVHGEVEAGPNAVLALAREGYRHTDVNAFDLAHTAAYPGFWRLAARFWRTGAYEYYRSFSTPAFVRSLQKLVPTLREGDVRRGGAGVRAQAVGPDGRVLDEFVIEEDDRSLHVLNAPSPAATASLTIGEHLAERVAAWGW